MLLQSPCTHTPGSASVTPIPPCFPCSPTALIQHEAAARALASVQVADIAPADLIISPHGGHQLSILFAREMAAIVEVMPFHYFAPHLMFANAGMGFRVLHTPGLPPRAGGISGAGMHVFAHIDPAECLHHVRWCRNWARNTAIRANLTDLQVFWDMLDKRTA